ncbi:MAG: RluA family pseudouridine synthase [Planctomycetes bacterium]|nr:RluA family pseudouridine synthase [Planctomycetota bacterium]
MRIFTISKELDRERADAVLHELVPEISRRAARALVDAGSAARDGVRAQPRERVRAGEEFKYCEHEETAIALGLAVFHENEDYLIINKPPGLASHGGPLVKDSVAARLIQLGAGAGLAQRLDRGSSGLMIIGRSPSALRDLAAMIENLRISKYYHAIVAGRVENEYLTIDSPLRVLDEPMGNRPKVIVDAAKGLPAVTRVRVIERFERYSFVEATIETGRTHQIRAHLSSVGHALLGDARYGNEAMNVWARETHGVARPLLHCSRMVVPAAKQPAADCEAYREPDFDRTLQFLRAYAG